MNIESAVLPKRTANRSKSRKENPFGPHVETREGRAVTVPASESAGVAYQIRAAARELDMGVRIVLMNGDDRVEPKQVKELPADAQIRVMFTGQDARKRRTKDEIAADAAK